MSDKPRLSNADLLRDYLYGYQITQRQLAEQLGLDPRTVNNYARGARPVPHVVMLCLKLLEQTRIQKDWDMQMRRRRPHTPRWHHTNR